MKTVRRLLPVVFSLALAASPAFGAAISFVPGPFIVDPTAIPGTSVGPFGAGFIDFTSLAIASNSGNGLGGLAGAGVFSEGGVANFFTFRDTTGAIIPATTSGLGLEYDLYALFDGDGVVVNNALPGVDGTFSIFDIEFWVDAMRDTVSVPPAVGGGPFGVANVADDFLVLAGMLAIGGFHVLPAGPPDGNFDVFFNVACPANQFLCGTGGLLTGMPGNFKGSYPTVTGGGPLGAGSSGTITLVGASDVSFQTVPEPITALLLATGVPIALALRRRRDGTGRSHKA